MLLLGCHVSVAGGLYRAFERGAALRCTTIQIFTKNQLRWVSRPITDHDVDLYYTARHRYQSIELVVAHGSYLTNLASGELDITEKSLVSLRDELSRCSLLKIPHLTIHPGSHMGVGELQGVENVVDCLRRVLQNDRGDTTICIETTAGQGTGIGYRFEHLRDIIQGAGPQRLGACIDTCHIYSAGYDIRSRHAYENTINRFDRTVGMGSLKLVHLNDSRGALGSRIDRHEHIGKGQIGREAFECIISDERLKDLPKIIETPKKYRGRDMDRTNLTLLRRMAYGS